MVNNKFIVRGYRLHHYTYTDAVNSLFTVHNESINVWSHLIGAMLFVGIIAFIGHNKAQFKQALENPLQKIADLIRHEALFFEDTDQIDR